MSFSRRATSPEDGNVISQKILDLKTKYPTYFTEGNALNDAYKRATEKKYNFKHSEHVHLANSNYTEVRNKLNEMLKQDGKEIITVGGGKKKRKPRKKSKTRSKSKTKRKKSPKKSPKRKSGGKPRKKSPKRKPRKKSPKRKPRKK